MATLASNPRTQRSISQRSTTRRPRTSIAVLALLVVASLLTTMAGRADAVVTEEVRTDTPIVLDGEVWDVEQVGNTIVVAGNFTRVQTSRNGPTVTQRGIFAYDLDSGRFLDHFRPVLANRPGSAKAVEIKDLEAADDGRSVYFAGRFVSVDDNTDGQVRTRNRIAKIDVSTGRLDRNFAQGGVDAKVLSISLSGGQLYAGGIFTEVYDTAPGRPPIFRDVRGLARFDALTGEYDVDFHFETHVDEGRTVAGGRMYGVARVDVTPNGGMLVVGHRGRELRDIRRNLTYERPGLAIIDLNAAGGPAVSSFRGLFPVANDPNQDFYWSGQCSGRGIQIKDLEISPDGSYFVTVNQGADSGYQCDTAVRWPITMAGAVRPDWVARIFDSVFSVGIADDAVYVGGHFRYMTTQSAPSSYPGRTVANGAPAGDIYYADPTQNRSNAIAFRNELFNPGYVFQARQIGAIDPTNGKGMETWTPDSNAFKCVCALTVIDRGLLIGHDRDRINGFNTGRSAFLDDQPDAGDPQCQVALDAQGRPLVTWIALDDVDQWNIAGNGAFVGSSTTAQFLDVDARGGQSISYEIRYNRNGLSHTDDCGFVFVEAGGTVNLARQGTATQSGVGFGGVASRAIDGNTDGAYDNDSVTHTDNGTNRWWSVDLGRQSNVQAINLWNRTDCCSERLADVSIFVSSEPIANGSIAQIRNRPGITEFSRTGPQGRLVQVDQTMDIRYVRVQIPTGVLSLAEVEVLGNRAPTLTCTTITDVDVNTVSWTDTGSDRYTVRRDGTFVASVEAGTSFTDAALAPGDYTYTVQAINAGAVTQSDDCTATVRVPSLTCTAVANGETATIAWTGNRWDRVTVRRDGSFVATVDDARSYRDAPPFGPNTYTLRAFVDGVRVDADCGIVTVLPNAPTCQVTVDGQKVVVSWTGDAWSRVAVQRDDSFRSSVRDDDQYVEEPGTGTYRYSIRAFSNGTRTDADCGTVTVAGLTLTCQATVEGDDVLLTWNDVGAGSYQARRNGSWAATLDAGATTWTDVGGAGNDHAIRFRQDGTNVTVLCV